MEDRDDEEKVRYAAPFIAVTTIIIVIVILRWDYIYPPIVDAWNSIFNFPPSVDECHYESNGCQNYNRWGQ